MTANILIVDDVQQNLDLLKAKLTQEYYNVVTASNGFEALSIMRSNSIDLILLDIMMPEMDGFECCKRLKQNPATTHIPIIMVTALYQSEDRVKGLQAGAEDFLTKPIRETALFARIKSLLRVKIMLDELKIRDKIGLELGSSNNYSDKAELKDTKILLIEDDIVQAKFIKTRLSEKNAKIDVISNNLNDYKYEIDDKNYDLIIVSTQLTDVDGLRICSQIRNNDKTRQIPLLALIEEDNEKVLIKALEIGVNDYLITPIDSSEIEARIITQIKRKRYQDALRRNYNQTIDMALTDSLTNLYNRRYFDSYMKQLIEQSKIQFKALSLILMDLDFFKYINDNYGHLVGDQVLRELSNRIKANIRLTDLPSRYGGEEFAVILPNTDSEEAKKVAERIRIMVANHPFKIEEPNISLNVTLSLGVSSLLDLSQDSVTALIGRADKALYKAKELGRNNMQFFIND